MTDRIQTGDWFTVKASQPVFSEDGVTKLGSLKPGGSFQALDVRGDLVAVPGPGDTRGWVSRQDLILEEAASVEGRPVVQSKPAEATGSPVNAASSQAADPDENLHTSAAATKQLQHIRPKVATGVAILSACLALAAGIVVFTADIAIRRSSWLDPNPELRQLSAADLAERFWAFGGLGCLLAGAVCLRVSRRPSARRWLIVTLGLSLSLAACFLWKELAADYTWTFISDWEAELTTGFTASFYLVLSSALLIVAGLAITMRTRGPQASTLLVALLIAGLFAPMPFREWPQQDLADFSAEYRSCENDEPIPRSSDSQVLMAQSHVSSSHEEEGDWAWAQRDLEPLRVASQLNPNVIRVVLLYDCDVPLFQESLGSLATTAVWDRGYPSVAGDLLWFENGALTATAGGYSRDDHVNTVTRWIGPKSQDQVRVERPVAEPLGPITDGCSLYPLDPSERDDLGFTLDFLSENTEEIDARARYRIIDGTGESVVTRSHRIGWLPPGTRVRIDDGFVVDDDNRLSGFDWRDLSCEFIGITVDEGYFAESAVATAQPSDTCTLSGFDDQGRPRIELTMSNPNGFNFNLGADAALLDTSGVRWGRQTAHVGVLDGPGTTTTFIETVHTPMPPWVDETSFRCEVVGFRRV